MAFFYTVAPIWHLLIGIVCGTIIWLSCDAVYRIYKKIDERGWVAFVPYYCWYILYKRTWNTKMFWISMPIKIVASVLSLIFESVIIYLGFYHIVSIVLMVFVINVGLVDFVLTVMLLHKISKSFGYNDWFTIGLIVCPFVFICIVGYNKCEYIGNTSIDYSKRNRR